LFNRAKCHKNAKAAQMDSSGYFKIRNKLFAIVFVYKYINIVILSRHLIAFYQSPQQN